MKYKLIILLFVIPFISISKPNDDIDKIRSLFHEGKHDLVLEVIKNVERIKNNGDVVGYSNTNMIENSPEYQHYKLSSTIYINGIQPSKHMVYSYDKLYRLDTDKKFINQKQYKELIDIIKKQVISSYKASHYQTTKMYVDALARWGDTVTTYHLLYNYRIYKEKTFSNKKDAEKYYQNYDYSLIDEYARITQSNDIETLTWKLTKDFDFKHEKIRAIYTWVTNNISYDYSFKSDNYHSTFKSRIATCAGYTDLFSLMLRYANIESDIVIGYADNGNPNENRLHGWSAVSLSGYSFWFDSTWDAVHGYKYYLIEPTKLTTHTQNYLKKAR